MPRDVVTDETIETPVHQVRTLFENLIGALVDEPDEVNIRVVQGVQAVIYEVEVHPDDVRRIIGRKGRTADACRELLTNLGSKAGLRFLLEIVEPQERSSRPSRHL